MTKRPTILVVEDEVVLNEAYQTILKHHGFHVLTAYDGDDALHITKVTEPDLILLDLRMPRMSGTDFLEAYQLTRKHPKVKVIVFSNLDAQRDIDKAYALGAHHYILKAWATPKELIRIVNEVLQD